MFLKDKSTPDGLFERIKERLVADGSMQGELLHDIISCARVTLQVVFLLLNIATYHKCKLIKIDIKGVFLRTPIMQGEYTAPYIIIKINKGIVPFWVRLDTEAE
jgi:hypothetical protein